MPSDDKSNYKDRDYFSHNKDSGYNVNGDDDLESRISRFSDKYNDDDYRMNDSDSGEYGKDNKYVPRRSLPENHDEIEKDYSDIESPDRERADYSYHEEEQSEERTRGQEESRRGGKKSDQDFFTDEDFELKGYDDNEYDDQGYRISTKKMKKRRNKMIFSSIAIMIILVLIAIGIVFGYRFIKNKYFNKPETTESSIESIIVPSDIKLGKDMNLVLACADNNLSEPKINSVIFSKYSAEQEELTSLCIPANTLFEIPGFGLDSIEKVVEFGGMDLMKLTLKNNIGMDVDNYILMDITSIVNKLESVKLELSSEIAISGEDDSSIKLKEGENILNGETAYSFLNYYSGTQKDVEVSNITMQKLLIDNILKKIIGTKEGDLSKNLSKISDYIETDLNLEELAEVISTIGNMENAKNKVYALDGRIEPFDENTLVFVPDISRVNSIFNPGEAAEEEIAGFETGHTMDIVVLNGVGVAGIAKKTSDLLVSLEYSDGNPRYEASEPADADNYNYDKTQIILKSEDENIRKSADYMAGILTVGNISVSEDGTQEEDIVLIIGKDFDYDKAEANAAQIKGGTESSQEEEQEENGEEQESEQTNESESSSEGHMYTVNILNGEGTQGIATTAKDIIEKALNKNSQTIQVKETKNADSFNYNITKIITHTDRAGIKDAAEKIRDALGIGTVSESDSNPDNVDITIILGSDFTK